MKGGIQVGKASQPTQVPDKFKPFVDGCILQKLPKNDAKRKDKNKRENKIADLLDKRDDIDAQISALINS